MEQSKAHASDPEADKEIQLFSAAKAGSTAKAMTITSSAAIAEMNKAFAFFMKTPHLV